MARAFTYSWRRSVTLLTLIAASATAWALAADAAYAAPATVVNPDLEQVTGGVPNCFSRSAGAPTTSAGR